MVTVISSQCLSLDTTGASEVPNGFTRGKLHSHFVFAVASSFAWSGGAVRMMISTFIVMRSAGVFGGDVIATVYRLRVVIATSQIEVELGDFRCKAGPIEI